MRLLCCSRRSYLPHQTCRHKSSMATDLSSFLQSSQGKDKTTTTFRGTLFEWQVLEAFQRSMGMQLQRVGGKSDRGVDLRGAWPLGSLRAVVIARSQETAAGKSSSTVRVRLPARLQPQIIAQCKNLKNGCTPDHVRSLVGTVVMMQQPAFPTIGILATVHHKPFTRDVIQHFMSSHVPLGLAKIADARLESLMFNEAAEQVLDGLTVTTEFNADGSASVPVLMYNGRAIRLLGDPYSK